MPPPPPPRGDADGRFRPRGAPAGSWPVMHYSHYMFHDKYEALNFWSHGLPGVGFLCLGAAAAARAAPGGPVLAAFCACAAVTHLLSALTHVFPDSRPLEKLDHLGIACTIIGTPATQKMAKLSGRAGEGAGQHDHVLLAVFCGLLLGAALVQRPALRTAGFVAVGCALVATHITFVDVPLMVQCALYASGALCFVRNGGHERVIGLQDHHLLHYTVTAACLIHCWNIVAHTTV